MSLQRSNNAENIVEKVKMFVTNITSYTTIFSKAYFVRVVKTPDVWLRF